MDSPFKGSGQLSGATVTFEPGAWTAWHSHPLGQTLLVVAGRGLIYGGWPVANSASPTLRDVLRDRP